ncbi:hypothetical protein YC2023_117831 [Brassica napus]
MLIEGSSHWLCSWFFFLCFLSSLIPELLRESYCSYTYLKSCSSNEKSKKVVEQYWEWKLSNETQPSWIRDSKEVTTVE